MPELAEVEFFRRRWNVGFGQRVEAVWVHSRKRVFRGVQTGRMKRALIGSVLRSSQAHGKRMIFRFSPDAWLGVHLGMSGSLRVESAGFRPGKHDHLVLVQRRRSLVFTDPRQFGRVQFHQGRRPPGWWSNLPPTVTSAEFTLESMAAFLHRHGRLSIKAALLLQKGFPGVGNWMADEILWRARLHPRTRSSDVRDSLKVLWQKVRFVSGAALKHMTSHLGDPPPGWLFHERWKRAGVCPLHGMSLGRAEIGGRTAVWCPRCQREGSSTHPKSHGHSAGSR